MMKRIRHQAGVSTTEFIAVLVGLIAAWQGIDLVLNLLSEHGKEFSWAAGLPL